MYTVAININELGRRYSLTVRDFDRSPHWRLDQDQAATMPSVFYDSRERDYFKPFIQLAEFMTETEARKFAAVVESAYTMAGWTRELVKVNTELQGELDG